MAEAHEYVFQSRWRVRGDIRDVAAILEDVAGLSRWWPSVYLDVRILNPGDQAGVGKRAALHTKGWLPYTLRWTLEVTESNSPHGFAITASGDFDGGGRWTLAQEGDDVAVTFDWRVRADKPLLRRLSFAFKPLFAANHTWAMACGEESLRLELARRDALAHGRPAPTASPQGPTFHRRRHSGSAPSPHHWGD